MDTFKQILDLFLHLQDHLHALTRDHGVWVYGVLFAIIFAETGLVVTPFLPGDSLLFAVGAIAANPESGLNVWLAGLVIFIAAVIGDTVNYSVGKFAGATLSKRYPRLIRPEYLAKTHEFFERYGGKTIILARFVPIVRTFAPFVAGSGAMDYRRFMMFNVVGAVAWVVLLLPAGWFFGNLPWVKKNFELVVLGIIFVSVLPMAVEVLREWAKKSQSPFALWLTRQFSILKLAGGLLIILGLVVAAWFFLWFDVSAPGTNIANLSRMNERLSGVILGVGISLLGGLLIVASERRTP